MLIIRSGLRMGMLLLMGASVVAGSSSGSSKGGMAVSKLVKVRHEVSKAA
jgi:hypothetical protein